MAAWLRSEQNEGPVGSSMRNDELIFARYQAGLFGQVDGILPTCMHHGHHPCILYIFTYYALLNMILE